MNLREFRKLLVETSGRYDLCNDDGSDAGGNRFIQLGQKHLETLTHWDKVEATLNFTLLGVSNFMLPNLRVINRVSARIATNERFVELVRISLTEARKYVMDQIQSNNGLPLFYTLFRGRGQVGETTADNFFDITETFQDILVNQNYNATGLLITPLLATSTVVYVEVNGLFRESKLMDDLDTNFWLEEHHNILLWATLREMEVMYRNTQGVKDWDAAIGSALIALEMDYVQDESNQISRMEG